MLEKPEIPDDLILSRLREEFGLAATRLAFLPLGADVNTAVYRVESSGGVYFLKLRKGNFDLASLSVPHFLASLGLRVILPPLEATRGALWGQLGPYRMILYPFVEGKDGYQRPLTPLQWLEFGAAMQSVHSARLPETLRRQLGQEDFTPRWREAVRVFQRQARQVPFTDPISRDLAAFMNARQETIDQVVERATLLAESLQPRFHTPLASPPPPDGRLSTLDSRFTASDPLISAPCSLLSPVLCHSDLHPGNLLLAEDERLYVVDWDNPILAPKERDLALIGRNGRGPWRSAAEEALFYQGYGPAQVDRAALAYYRCERVVQDIAAFCEQLFLSDSGGDDRLQSYRYLTGSFEPGNDIEVALATEFSV